MFSKCIRETQLTSQVANSYFENIKGDKILDDNTLLSTLRALISSRMGEDETVYVKYYSRNVSHSDCEGIMNDLFGRTSVFVSGTSGVFQIVNMSYSSTDKEMVMDNVKSSFVATYPGWERISRITDFYRKTFVVHCFVNRENRNVVVVTDGLDVRRLHYLQCAIFPMMPWYFNPDEGVTQLEMDLINSLRERESDKYLEIIGKFASQYDLRTAHIRKALKGFEHIVERQQLEEAMSLNSSYLARIENIQRELSDVLSNKRNNDIFIMGLNDAINSESDHDSEIMEYFLANKSLILDNIDREVITFGVKGYFENYDMDLAETIITNPRAEFYCNYLSSTSKNMSNGDMHRLMAAIFLDKKLKMRVCAKYRFSTTRSGGISGASYDYEYNGYTPNPHIDQYSCLGNYERIINECLASRDYVMAIEQCVASCKSLNFGDSCVMKEFGNRLFGNRGDINTKCIELPDGTVVDPVDAVKWLKEQESVEEGEANGQED